MSSIRVKSEAVAEKVEQLVGKNSGRTTTYINLAFSAQKNAAMRPVNEGRVSPWSRLKPIKHKSQILRAREYIWALLACGVGGESYGHHADVRIVSRPVFESKSVFTCHSNSRPVKWMVTHAPANLMEYAERRARRVVNLCASIAAYAAFPAADAGSFSDRSSIGY